jgi:hypothetical protein
LLRQAEAKRRAISKGDKREKGNLPRNLKLVIKEAPQEEERCKTEKNGPQHKL